MANTLMRVDEALDHMPTLTRAGTAVARAAHRTALAGEKQRQAADILHGTWLGHPFHPVLTDVTIGAWTVGAAFDAAGELGDSDAARRVGDRLAAGGAASALGTALSGLADYSTVPKPAATTATLHGLLNAVNLALYVASIRNRRKGCRARGLLYSGIALAGTTVSAWLGGRLVYKEKVGVDHSETFAEPKQWTRVLAAEDLPLCEPRRVTVDDGKGVLLYRDDDGVHAIGAVCSHAGGPLEEGHFDGPCVRCPWHDSVFDVRDGRIVHGPATQPQPSFDARIHDGRIELRLRHA